MPCTWVSRTRSYRCSMHPLVDNSQTVICIVSFDRNNSCHWWRCRLWLRSCHALAFWMWSFCQHRWCPTSQSIRLSLRQNRCLSRRSCRRTFYANWTQWSRTHPIFYRAQVFASMFSPPPPPNYLSNSSTGCHSHRQISSAMLLTTTWKWTGAESFPVDKCSRRWIPKWTAVQMEIEMKFRNF